MSSRRPPFAANGSEIIWSSSRRRRPVSAGRRRGMELDDLWSLSPPSRNAAAGFGRHCRPRCCAYWVAMELSNVRSRALGRAQVDRGHTRLDPREFLPDVDYRDAASWSTSTRHPRSSNTGRQYCAAAHRLPRSLHSATVRPRHRRCGNPTPRRRFDGPVRPEDARSGLEGPRRRSPRVVRPRGAFATTPPRAITRRYLRVLKHRRPVP